MPPGRRVIGHLRGIHSMTQPTRAGLGAALLLPIVLIVAACGGSSTTATPTPTPTPVADGNGNGNGNDVPTPPAGALPSFDLGALTGGIPGLDSYRTSFSTNGVKSYESVVVTKPELSKAITTYNDDGTVDSRFVVIGKEVWQADGADGDFNAVPEALATPMLMIFDPTAMLAGYAALDWAHAATNVGTEDKNGVRAVHVRIDPTTIVGASANMPAGSSVDVWIAEAGYVVSWEMSGFNEGQNIAIQVTDVNDGANKVERPN
jgi:hypothetical protein